MRWSIAIAAVAACSVERDLPDPQPEIGVHSPGFLDENSDDFHVRDLERHDWDLNLCAKCHGEDFAGGTAQVSCLTCHPAGPDACTTCHKTGPITGAHVIHRTAGQDCGQCHLVPTRWDDEGHIRRQGVADPAP